MLYVDGDPLSNVSLEVVLALPCMQQATSSFLQQLDGCSSTLPDNSGPYLCLVQGEEASVDAGRLPGLIIGSQDATTCMIAILTCPATRLVWCAHFDQLLGQDDIALLLSMLSSMQQPQLYLTGGYCDTQGRGPATAQAFLQALHSLQPPIQLQLACVAAANTAPDGSPRSCCLVLDTASQTPHPWTFSNRGPELPRRLAAQHCRHYSNSVLISVWCQQQHALVLPSFDPTCLSSWQVLQYERLLRQPDQQLLQVMSTSPDHEPPWFVKDMRSMLRFLIKAQEPHSQERSAASRATRYTWSSASGSWASLEPAATSGDATVAATGGSVPVEAVV